MLYDGITVKALCPLSIASHDGRPVMALADVNGPLTGYNLDQGLYAVTRDPIGCIPER